MDTAQNLATIIAHHLQAEELRQDLLGALRFGHARPPLAQVREILDRQHGDLDVDDDTLRRLISTYCAPPRSARRIRSLAPTGQLPLPFLRAA